MTYREVQKSNCQLRNTLSIKEKSWLKDNGYKNVGWDNIIKLYRQLNEFLPSLEDLFLEADRIGNRYQTSAEIKEFNENLSRETEAIAALIDSRFPDTEPEVIDFSNSTKGRRSKKGDRKTYRTVKI